VQAAIELDERAEEDLVDIVEFVVGQSATKGHQFAEAYERSVLALRSFPLMGVDRGGLRWLPIGRTGYVLVYEVKGELIRVLAVRHAKDPRPLA